MSAKRFTLGQAFYWGDAAYEVARLLPDGKINIENVLTGEMRTETRMTLVEALFSGKLRFPDDTRPAPPRSQRSYTLPEEDKIALSDYPEPWVTIARYRLEFITPLLDLAPRARTEAVIKARVVEMQARHPEIGGDQTALKASDRRSIQRWIKTYQTSGGDIRALMPNYRRCGGQGKSRLAPALGALVDRIINDHCFGAELVTAFDIQCLIAVELEQENRYRATDERLDLPHLSTIERRIAALDPEKRYEAKHGKAATKRAFRQYDETPYPTVPLHRVEIDHTPIDLLVVDEDDGLILGSPTLTYCLDVATRFPLGYYIGFEPPSYYTVMECLHHAVQSKPDTRARYNTEHEWLAYGIPAVLVVDQGREFIGRDLEEACLGLGIILEPAPVRTPEFKAAVERQFRTANSRVFHQLPGTLFSNPQARKDYDSEKHACLSLDELQAIFNIYLVDVYAQRFQRRLTACPADKWNEAVQAGFAPRLPASSEDLLPLLGRVEERTVQHYGIEFMHLLYNSPELGPIRARLRKKRDPAERKVKMKYHPGDMSRVYVLDEVARHYIEVPALARNYTENLSLWKHRVILQFARQEEKKVDLAALGRAKLKIQEIVDIARKRKRRRGRTNTTIGRWDKGGQPPSLEGQKPSPTDEAANVPSPAPPPKSDTLPPSEPTASDDGWEIAYTLPTPAKED